MKIGNPNSRNKLSIPRSAYVLDVGSGHNPHPRANVIADKFIDTNYHRADNIKILNNQKFVEADGQALPFKDKEFDYVICCHVVEHVDDPTRFLTELSRVGKKGYLEAPSLVGELLIPKESHQWVLLDIDKKIILVNKKRLGFNTSLDFGELFLDFLPKNSIGFKILQRTHPQLLTINYEWSEKIEFEVDPPDEKLRNYFTTVWDRNMYHSIFPKRTLAQEFWATTKAFVDILGSVIKSKLLK
ncbi:MAG: class I SAM-dependent methyltransferase [Cyclobacteriaceae bacterium]|nr:class I SAM-dependent methyltransferase [Cyclobacteriaceae bacterium]